jgi:hypothetical protein
VIDPSSYHPCRETANAGDYETLFIPRVHRLIKLGYDRLSPRSAANDEETAITGDLVEAIENVLDSAASDWMKFYSAHDDPPENSPTRKKRRRRGRHRRRVDIRLDSSETSPRTRFRFECKRLGPRHHAEGYLGDEGLGCFLRGEYASKETRAGMLGYVQCDDELTWANRIAQCLSTAPSVYSVRSGGDWRREALIEELPHTYRSSHRRGSTKPPIEIYHTLLRFC